MQRLQAHRRALAVGLIIAGVGAFRVGDAAIIECGPSICFQYDETQAAIASLGAPFRVGDTMQFLPASFLVLSASGAGPAQATASFVFERIFSVGGGEIVELQVTEEGDYEIVGSGTVSASLQLTARSNLAPETAVGTAVFDDSNDSAGAQLWTTTASVAPASAFLGAATDIEFTIDNLLQASASGSGDLAWLQKKFVVSVGEAGPATSVPLPGAAWLFSIGMTMSAWLGGARRRTGAPIMTTG
jgi:hypothetical protein